MIIIEYWKMKNPKHDEWCKNLLQHRIIIVWGKKLRAILIWIKAIKFSSL
jgi:hypothetical protein